MTITTNLAIEEATGYQVEGGVLLNAPCCCYGEDHRGHPYCEEPTQELLNLEQDGLIYRRLDNSGWVWIVAD